MFGKRKDKWKWFHIWQRVSIKISWNKRYTSTSMKFWVLRLLNIITIWTVLALLCSIQHLKWHLCLQLIKYLLLKWHTTFGDNWSRWLTFSSGFWWLDSNCVELVSLIDYVTLKTNPCFIQEIGTESINN